MFTTTVWLHNIGKYRWSLVWGEWFQKCCGNAPKLDTRAGVSLLIGQLVYCLFEYLHCIDIRTSHHSEPSIGSSIIAARPHMDVKFE